MKRLTSPLFISLLTTAALMFGAFACSSDRAANSGGHKFAVEPDSVRGDTVFYGFDFLHTSGNTVTNIFATWDGQWHQIVPWNEIDRAPTHIFGAQSYVTLGVSPADSANIAEARAFVEANGDSIGYYLYNSDSTDYIFTSWFWGDDSYPIPSDRPLIEKLHEYREQTGVLWYGIAPHTMPHPPMR